MNSLVEHLKGEVNFLRKQIEVKTDFLPQKTEEYFGGGRDQFAVYDQFGAKVIVEEDVDLERTV